MTIHLFPVTGRAIVTGFDPAHRRAQVVLDMLKAWTAQADRAFVFSSGYNVVVHDG